MTRPKIIGALTAAATLTAGTALAHDGDHATSGLLHDLAFHALGGFGYAVGLAALAGGTVALLARGGHHAITRASGGLAALAGVLLLASL